MEVSDPESVCYWKSFMFILNAVAVRTKRRNEEEGASPISGSLKELFIQSI